MKISGIYQIQSKSNPKRIYIGSAVNIHDRWLRHLSALKRGIRHSIKLQNHYNKYGKEDLVFSIIIGCSKDDLLSTEQFFIDAKKPYFNICKHAGSTLGRRLSSEAKIKISKSRSGKIPWNKGKTFSLESRIKMSNSQRGNKNNLGHKHSDESRLKMTLSRTGDKNHFFGKHHSEETKQKMRKPKPEGFRQKLMGNQNGRKKIA